MLRHFLATTFGTAVDPGRRADERPSSLLSRLSSLRARLLGLLGAILLPWLGLLL